MDRPLIAVTMGDPAGIGPEVCAKALSSKEVKRISRCVLIGDAKTLKYAIKVSKLPGVSVNPIKNIEEAGFQKNKIDVLDLDNVNFSKIKIGTVSKMAGKASMQYVECAIELALSGKVEAMTTGPINKTAIQKAGYRFKGHTELLVKRTKARRYAMMFVSDNFWVILATTHLALKDVSRALSKKRVLETIRLAHETVGKVRGRVPRIGVAGLNPHAGEGGLFGKEEKKYITPAVLEAKKMGMDVKGPISPDAIFYLANAGVFDVVVAMYHDQGLIPLKLVSFNRSVNVTAGLPIIRTSVDHGTGFDIAGKGWANPQSLIQAIEVASHFARAK